MSELVSMRGNRIARADARRYSGELTHLRVSTDLTLARTDAVVDRKVAQAEAAVQVTRRAMEGAALITQFEQQLEQMVPGTATRVGFIADRGVLALGEIVSDTVTALRRLS